MMFYSLSYCFQFSKHLVLHRPYLNHIELLNKNISQIILSSFITFLFLKVNNSNNYT